MHGFMPVFIYTYVILVLHIKKTNSEKSPVFFFFKKKQTNKQETAISTALS